jgi:hypothetical protein
LKIAQADTHQAEELLRSKINPATKRQRYRRELFTGTQGSGNSQASRQGTEFLRF